MTTPHASIHVILDNVVEILAQLSASKTIPQLIDSCIRKIVQTVNDSTECLARGITESRALSIRVTVTPVVSFFIAQIWFSTASSQSLLDWSGWLLLSIAVSITWRTPLMMESKPLFAFVSISRTR